MRKMRLVVSVCVFVMALFLGSAATGYAADAKAGKAVYDKTKCAMCHGKDGKGTKMGPAVAGKGNAKAIADGVKPKMPAYGKKLKSADIANVVEYLKSLKK